MIINITLIYSPKHLFDLASLCIVILAFCPLLIKKCNLNNVVSMIVLGISSRIDAIFNNQLRAVYWADYGILDYMIVFNVS